MAQTPFESKKMGACHRLMAGFYFLEVYFQFLAGDGVEEVLQLMYIPDRDAGAGGVPEAQAFFRE